MESYRPLAAAPELQQDWSQPQQADRSATWPELFTVRWGLCGCTAADSQADACEQPLPPSMPLC